MQLQLAHGPSLSITLMSNVLPTNSDLPDYLCCLQWQLVNISLLQLRITCHLAYLSYYGTGSTSKGFSSLLLRWHLNIYNPHLYKNNVVINCIPFTFSIYLTADTCQADSWHMSNWLCGHIQFTPALYVFILFQLLFHLVFNRIWWCVIVSSCCHLNYSCLPYSDINYYTVHKSGNPSNNCCS